MGMPGSAYLPLHGGHTPPKLFRYMVSLATPLLRYMYEEIGGEELLERLANPFFFQALGATLGFDWHSSGVTTVLTGVLEKALPQADIGIKLVGGKGRKGRSVPEQVMSDKSLSEEERQGLIRISRTVAKTDTVMLQDGYEIYHHALLYIDGERWIVIQQGMNTSIGYARRYHWSHREGLNPSLTEPHIAIMTERYEEGIINLTAKESEEAKKTMLDIIRDGALKRELQRLIERADTGLNRWLGIEDRVKVPSEVLVLPRKIDWEEVRRIYMDKPSNYQELIGYKGFNKATVRALALISSLVYGEEPSWRDTVKYTFTVGGKDGVPYPVDYPTYRRVIDFIREAVENSGLEARRRREMLRRLRNAL